ncbi:MAG TPA: FAD:protein FMN transferase [Bacillota bacterium]|jgi:thiamine biosynthesis lipoprotein ApbE|nr:FAD:protein FMN transferase [Bacillota bacterium]
MRKLFASVIIILVAALFLTGCQRGQGSEYRKYSDGFFIDPDTLMPGEHSKAVTVVTEDSGMADLISTAVFLMPYQEGREFVEGLDGAEAVWVLQEGRVEATEGMKKMLKSYGASGAL